MLWNATLPGVMLPALPVGPGDARGWLAPMQRLIMLAFHLVAVKGKLFGGKVSELAEFLSDLVEESERAREGVFPCFGWHIKYQYWKKETSCRARPLSSVVLPPVTKDKLVTDIQHFLSPETSAFYLQHGIPYRRSYLFYGLPGTGKTSLVQVGHDACFSAAYRFVPSTQVLGRYPCLPTLCPWGTGPRSVKQLS